MRRVAWSITASFLALGLALPVLAQPKPPAFAPLNLAVAKQSQLATLDTLAVALAYDDTQGVLAVAGDDRNVYLWTRADGKDLLAADRKPVTASGAASGLLGVAVGGGVCAASSSDGKVLLWKLPATKPTVVVQARKPIRALAISPDGKLVAGAGEDGAVQLWDEGGKPVRELTGSADWQQALAFSPDGKQLAAGGLDGKLWAWEVASGKKLFDGLAQAPPAPKADVITNHVSAMAYAPDGKQVAVGGSNGQVYLFQSGDGKFVRVMQQPHAAGVTAVAFHPGSAALASASRDRVVRLWSPANGQLLKALEGHTGWVEGAAFAEKGTKLVTAGADRTVRVWDLTDPPKPAPPKK